MIQIQQLNERQLAAWFNSMEFFLICCELIEQEYIDKTVHVDLKNSAIRNHKNQIIKSVKAIRLHTASVLKRTTEQAEEDGQIYIHLLWKIMHHLNGAPDHVLQSIVDGFDKVNPQDQTEELFEELK